MDWSEFELYAGQLHAEEVKLLRRKAALAWVAREAGAAPNLAGMWHNHSKQRINTLADICENFYAEHITLETSESVFKAAIECAEQHADDPKPWKRSPRRWWLLARRYGWSSRKLKNAAYISKGKHVSRVDLVRHRAEVLAWEPGRIEVNVPGWEPSGERPAEVELRAREVLKTKGDDNVEIP